MNTNRLQQLLDRYNPENDGGHGVTYAESLLLEAVIELAARVATLEAATRPAPAFAQPDAPAEPGKRIELTYRALSVSSVDVCMDCIAYATPPGTVAGCWAHLEKMRERGEIPQTQYDEIRRMADFIEAD